ncbi:MAG: hypothetical protein M3R61_14350 [Chloroflexota bacterium]|nr:hypothetical protein [Chloroflexota bacterium]
MIQIYRPCIEGRKALPESDVADTALLHETEVVLLIEDQPSVRLVADQEC